MSTQSILLVFIGGGCGAVVRYAIGTLFQARGCNDSFPWHTWLINVIGSFVLGMVAGLFADRPSWKLLLGVGVCGGFTTFSTFSLEMLQLLKSDRGFSAIGYAVGSVTSGMLGAWLGLRWTETRSISP